MQDIRKSPEYQRWRREVRQRDGDACRVCGVQLNLHIHHIRPLERYPDFATELDNGITLCGNHHALLTGREESTNLQTIIEAVTGQHDMRTADQLRRLNNKFCAYLEPLLKSSDPNTRNNAFYQLFTHLQIYPDSLDQFLPLIQHLLNKENSRFNQGLVAQIAVEYLKGSSSGTALQVLREYEERVDVERRRRKAEEEEVRQLRPLAERGNTEAQCHLGVMYATGKGIERNDRAAVYWYRKAALQGDADAQFRLGMMYANGRAIHDTTAVNWYRKAAEQGHAEAQYTLGQMCEDGLRDQEAFQWYHQAAKQGHAEAQYRLGQIYENSDEDSGVRYFKDYSPIDKAEALYWYIEAAEQGHTEAQYKLGEMYENIEMDEDIAVCLRDYSGSEDYKAEAIKWYRKAAEGGYPAAQTNLNWLYQNNGSVEQI